MNKRLLRAAIIGVVLMGGLGGLVYVWHNHHPKINAPVSVTRVTVSPVRQASAPIVVRSTATLIANQQTNISSKVAGYIQAIHFSEGAYVKAGDIIISLDNTKEQQTYVSAQSAAELAKNTYERYAKLRATGVISKQDIDQYQAKYEQAVADAKAAAKALADMQLSAPFAGYLGPISLSIGNLVAAGQSLISLTDTNHLRIKYTLPSRYASRLALGQSVQIRSEEDDSKKAAARVSFIAPSVDPQTQSIEVHADLDNQKQLFKPGESVVVKQTLGTIPNAIQVPVEAVVVNINGAFVYQVKEGVVVMTPVNLGESLGHWRVINHGLHAGDEVITQGQYQVKAGQHVDVTH